MECELMVLTDPYFVYGYIKFKGQPTDNALVEIYDMDDYQNKVLYTTNDVGMYQVNIQNHSSSGNRIRVNAKYSNYEWSDTFNLNVEDLFKKIDINIPEYNICDNATIEVVN